MKKLTSRFLSFCKEIWFQFGLWLDDGRQEVKLYRLERDQAREDIIWAPCKGDWVRARVIRHGFRYDRIRFVDGKGKRGHRSPLSCRPRNPRAGGADRPRIDPQNSGNFPSRLDALVELYTEGFYRLTHSGYVIGGGG